MKNRAILKKCSWLLALCVASAIGFSACGKKTDEHPTGPEHPTTDEHPKKADEQEE